MFYRRGVVCLLSLCFLTGCLEGHKEKGGALIGAGTGALIGAQFGDSGTTKLLTAGAGAVLGGFLGSSFGRMLDEDDRRLQEQATLEAMEFAAVNQALPWRNERSGHCGAVTPLRTYKKRGRYCREFRQSIEIGGKIQQAYGRACRQPDGQWEIIQ